MKKLLKIAFCLIIFTFSISPSFSQTVVFNTNTKKMHSPSCVHAKKCTVNCIKIEKVAAVKKGGIPCKVCGGG